jgi:predicted site-specific integrase-resolvase
VEDKEIKMYTVKEVSEKTGIPVSTINLYCRNGDIPHAVRNESPIGVFWLIPETDLPNIPQRKRGRPAKTKREN